MSDPILGFASRIQIREVLIGYPADRIERYFALGDFYPDESFNPHCRGDERKLVERYYVSIDFTSPEAVQRFFIVLQEILHDLQPAADRLPWQHASDLAEEHFGRLIRFLAKDNIEHDGTELRISRGVVEGIGTRGLAEISEETINGYVLRAKRRLSDGDYPAAITISYTLVEAFLKALLEAVGTPAKTTEGDIRQLYGALKEPLNLNPAGQNIESYLRLILDGLQKQITGLFDLANKASDRHALTYEPQRHHAHLAVNTAFTLCEFLLGAWEHQQANEL